MKKLFAISFFFIYLFSTTELSQLLKMPLLVEHFIERREENSHLTLWKFLYMHYAMGDVHDADYAKDMKLPFKSHDNCASNVVTVDPPVQKFSIIEPVPFLEKTHFYFSETFMASSFLANIWQPPRFC